MNEFKRKIIAGIGANSYGQLATILIQIAAMPIFLSHWTLEKYGTWLAISALPAYISMADVGLVSVASTQMTMAAGAGNFSLAQRIFSSSQKFFLFVAGSVLVLLIGISAVLATRNIYGISELAPLILLAICTLLSMANGLNMSVFKATNRYAKGTAWDVHTRLAEWIAGIFGLLYSGTFLAVASAMLVGRLVFLGITTYIAVKPQTDFSYSLRDSDSDLIKGMIRPAVGFMAFPISNAAAFQGFTLLTAALLGPAAVAIFNAYRTLSRVTVQCTGVVSHALWPEISRMYGAGRFTELTRVYKRFFSLGNIVAVFSALAVLLLSPYFLEFWTHGKISFDLSLMLLFTIYAALGSSWHLSRIYLIATMNHVRFSIWVLTVSLGSLFVAYLGGKIYGIYGIAAAMMFSEAVLAIISNRAAFGSIQLNKEKEC